MRSFWKTIGKEVDMIFQQVNKNRQYHGTILAGPWLSMVNFPLELTFYKCQWSKFFWCWLTFWLRNQFLRREPANIQASGWSQSWFINLSMFEMCVQLKYSNDNTYLHNIVTCNAFRWFKNEISAINHKNLCWTTKKGKIRPTMSIMRSKLCFKIR